jgi:hypothetical protein
MYVCKTGPDDDLNVSVHLINNNNNNITGENSCTGHSTHTAESANVEVQNVQHGK